MSITKIRENSTYSLALVLFLLICSTGCSIETHETITMPIASSVPTPIPSMTVKPSSSPSPYPTEVQTKASLSPTPELKICPPLPDYSRDEIISAISNVFNPPARAGSDDPHQAVDLAVVQYGIAMAGDPVQAILAGRVAAVVKDRFPYGNALLVETTLEGLPQNWLTRMQVPTPAPTLEPHPSLTCPQLEEPLSWDSDRRSLYLLYAHLQEPIHFQANDRVGCGENIGVIGQSGNALNPHLHLEVRVGPSGVIFNSLAHYSGGITPEEMRNYCAWRVSGVFQLIDPERILRLLPK